MAEAETVIQCLTKVNDAGATEPASPVHGGVPYPAGVVTVDVVSIEAESGGSVVFGVQVSQDGSEWHEIKTFRPISRAGRYRACARLPLPMVRLAYACASVSDVCFLADVTLAYCCGEDLRERVSDRLLLKWADDDNDGELSAEEESGIAGAALAAGAEIDAIAQASYVVPFCPAPDEIRAIASRCAIRLLSARKGFPDGEDDRYRAAWERDMAFLDAVASRGLSLSGGIARRRELDSTTRTADTNLSSARMNRESGAVENADFSRKLDDF
ncbi:MAG TPA: DUF1320 family protein [Candidatus Brocadiia bacterium]|nr:DUF1320 family protein [Candidatus Brocadiia bacterium]